MPPPFNSNKVADPNACVQWPASTGLWPCSIVWVSRGAVRLAVAAQQKMLSSQVKSPASCWLNRNVLLTKGFVAWPPCANAGSTPTFDDCEDDQGAAA